MALYTPNAPQFLDRFERLLELLELPGKNRLRFVTAILAMISTLAIWIIHYNHPLMPGNYDSKTLLGIIIVASAPPFLAVLCIGFSLSSPPKEGLDEKLPIFTSLENPNANRRRRIVLVAGVFGAANCLLMMGTSHITL
jgi:hypothetical protein